MKPTNLDLLDDVVGRVTLFGKDHDVLALDGAAYRMLYDLEANKRGDVRPLFDIAARIVPSLTADEVGRLTAMRVGAILAIAGAPVQAVESEFPNSDGPTTPTAATPAQP